MTTLEQLLTGTYFVAIIGGYIYIHKVERGMRKKQGETEESVQKAMEKTQKALTELTLTVTNRLTAIETQLGIQLPKKGAGGEST